MLVSLMLLGAMITSTALFGQGDKVRASLKASVSQTIGVDTEIEINYSRPGVKGRTVWGELVPYGLNEGNKYSNNKPFPWRAGANENTTISISKDVTVNGESLPAGTYSIHMVPGKDEFEIIFNKGADAWGSYSYDQSQDALRIKVKPVEAGHQEWLAYGFEDLNGNSATAFLHWEKLKIPFTIATAG